MMRLYIVGVHPKQGDLLVKKIAALIASCAAAAAFAVPATLSLTPPADNAVAATATSAVDYPIVLKEGMRGKDVTALQLMLRYSSPDLKVDGVFGAKTKAAVIAKQKAAGIAADGVAGDDTLNALMVKVRSGDRSLATAATQTLLNKHGASIEVDGVAGTATMSAIKEFQGKKGLQVDGVVGPNTWSALYGEPQSDSAPVPNERAQVAEYAKKFVNGDAIPAKTLEGGVTTQPWKGGAIPYTWSGGHAKGIGPTVGNCDSWRKDYRCLAEERVGVDCSGFARWAYALAYGKDVLGPSSSKHQAKKGQVIKRSELQPGDAVFYGNSTDSIYHVAIYIGDGKVAHTYSQKHDPAIDTIDDAAGGNPYFRRY